METRAEIRNNMLKYMQLFISENCAYNELENRVVKQAQEDISYLNEEYEKHNDQFPNHGKPFTTEPLH